MRQIALILVIYVGLHIVSPLISLDLLRYPKLSRDYFALVSHMLGVYPEKVAQLNKEAFAHIIGTLDFSIQHQDTDVVDMCLRAVNALASYHYKERITGKRGLGAHAIDSQGSNGKLQESILSHFLRLLLQLLLFEDFRMELAGSASDALLPLLLCKPRLEEQESASIKEEWCANISPPYSVGSLKKRITLLGVQYFQCFKPKRMKDLFSEWKKYLEEEARIMKDVPGCECVPFWEMDAPSNWQAPT